MSRLRLRLNYRWGRNYLVTEEKKALLEQVIAFVRIRRVSRRASAAEARAAVELEEHLEQMLVSKPEEREAVAA